MKGCFLLQRRFAHIGHYVAVHLQEKYGVTDFCGLVYMRSSYEWLKQQKDIAYSTLLLDEDIQKKYHNEKVDLNYLAELEKKYGIPNLWPYLMIDRTLMHNIPVREYPHDTSPWSHEELIRILQAYARTIISFLEKEKPDFLFCSVIGGIAGVLLYHIAKTMGIKTLFVIEACTAKRLVISETYNDFSDIGPIFERNKENIPPAYLDQAQKFLKDFRAQPQPYDSAFIKARQVTNRGSHWKFIQPKHLGESIRWFAHLLKEYSKQKKFKDYSYDSHPGYYLLNRLKRKTRNLIGLSDLYDTFNPNCDFAYYSLHYEPEISTMLYAPFYVDQKHVIKQIARSLPVHYTLYVKEHPVMVAYRPRSFYKEIKKMPNVKLLDPSISAYSIIPHARLITTVAGTTPWEGVMFQKPAINFGDRFYNRLAAVKRCREIEQLPYLVKEQLEHYQPDEKELLAFLAAVFENSVAVDLRHLWEKEWDLKKKKAGLEPLADALAKKLGL